MTSCIAMGSKNGTRKQSVRVKLPLKTPFSPPNNWIAMQKNYRGVHNIVKNDGFIDPFENKLLDRPCGKLQNPSELFIKKHESGVKKARVKDHKNISKLFTN